MASRARCNLLLPLGSRMDVFMGYEGVNGVGGKAVLEA